MNTKHKSIGVRKQLEKGTHMVNLQATVETVSAVHSTPMPWATWAPGSQL